VGYYHLVFLFSIGVLLLVVFLTLCIFVGGGVTYAYMCGFLVDRVRLCFEFLCYFVYICILFSVLVYFTVFFVFVFVVVSCVSSTPNEDIVKFMCGGSHIPFSYIFW